MKKFCALLLAAMLLSACGNPPEQVEVTTITTASAVALDPLVTEADPKTAVKKIYESVKVEDISEADARDLSRRFSIDTTLVDDFAARYASGKYGIANVFILKPKTDEDASKLRDQLEQIKLSLVRECEHYDIYNSHQIAQDAQIFEQGGYLILLMLADNDAARNVIDLYIPKN